MLQKTPARRRMTWPVFIAILAAIVVVAVPVIWIGTTPELHPSTVTWSGCEHGKQVTSVTRGGKTTDTVTGVC